MWQARHVQSLLLELGAPEVELLPMKTTGDKILDVPLAKIGGKGLFVKEIEEAILDGRADLAVHSMKDVPTEQPEGLIVGVVPEREIPTDTLLSMSYESLDALPEGAKIGTSSLRRQAQLLILRPDLQIESLRGNVNTRLRKLNEGRYDAIVMATAGIKRLGLTAPKHLLLEPPAFLPAIGQGALGIEYRADDTELAKFMAPLNHHASRICVTAERGFLKGLDGGCQVPIAAYATLKGDIVCLEGLVADCGGKRVIRRQAEATADRAEELGLDLAREVLDAGGKPILDELYQRD